MTQRNVLKVTVPDRVVWLPKPACIGVRECIFLGMQKIFAQIWSCFSQITYKQQALMLTLNVPL